MRPKGRPDPGRPTDSLSGDVVEAVEVEPTRRTKHVFDGPGSEAKLRARSSWGVADSRIMASQSRANSSCSGKALLSDTTMRRTLRLTSAPILSTRVRIVPHWALCNALPTSPSTKSSVIDYVTPQDKLLGREQRRLRRQKARKAS